MPERKRRDNRVEGVKLPGFARDSSALTYSVTFFDTKSAPASPIARQGERPIATGGVVQTDPDSANGRFDWFSGATVADARTELICTEVDPGRRPGQRLYIGMNHFALFR